MGIDYVIDYECVPKRILGVAGLLAKLKARQRAQAVIQLYRDRGENRPPSAMGFEMVRRAADGSEEVQVIIVQDMLDEAAPLDDLKAHCTGCPANLLQRPYGCFNTVNYPISGRAELWLLTRLPTPDQPLLFLLVQQAAQDVALNTALTQQIAAMRAHPGVYFQSGEVLGRRYDELTISTNHLFQLLFLPESIQPAYGALLLLLLGAIPRDLDAQALMALTAGKPEPALPFLLDPTADDDHSVVAIKDFLRALHRAHHLGVGVSLDA
jgi:hypothetical protein